MSAHNVEGSRRVWERFLAGDIQGVYESLDENIVIREPPELPGARVYRGRRGWSEQIMKFQEAIGDIEYRVVEHLDFGDDVVTVVEARGVGSASGIPGEATYAEIETWRAGKVVSIEYFVSKEAALEAVRTP